jgi:hypothetical protein
MALLWIWARSKQVPVNVLCILGQQYLQLEAELLLLGSTSAIKVLADGRHSSVLFKHFPSLRSCVNANPFQSFIFMF